MPDDTDVFDLDVSDPGDGRQWMVLYPEDYDVMLDGKDQVGLLIDMEQAGEIVRLATTAIASMSARADDGDDVLRSLIDALENELSEGSDD